jgi:hypothetical protein
MKKIFFSMASLALVVLLAWGVWHGLPKEARKRLG